MIHESFLYNAGIKISVNVMMEILLRLREGQNAYSAQEQPTATCVTIYKPAGAGYSVCGILREASRQSFQPA